MMDDSDPDQHALPADSVDGGHSCDSPHCRSAYHHGDLPEALLKAVRTLVERDGPSRFSMAEACRMAGVSTAAPYRHFKDKTDVVRALAITGFSELARLMQQAADQHAVGSVDAVAEIGWTYVQFAARNPQLFKILFGAHPDIKADPDVKCTGLEGYQVLLQTLANHVGRAPTDPAVTTAAVPLWTFVHGAASLLIDHDYANVTPDLQLRAMIDNAAAALIVGFSRAPTA